MELNFENTEIAFANKTNKELIKAYWMYKTIASPKFVKIGEMLIKLALKINFPIKWIIKPTIFSQFCGGENINECKFIIEKLGSSNIKSILDFAAEGIDNENNFEKVKKQIIEIIEIAKDNNNIPFAVFKVTGIARFKLLEKYCSNKQLTDEEYFELERVKKRIDEICSSGFINNVPVMIDAEESWIQDFIDQIATEMMMKYNRQKAIIFNTLQMYRIDRLEYLINQTNFAKKEGIFLGYKIVRGAYMEKERERALKNNYISPIHKSKQETDESFNNAILQCIKNIDTISICNGSHNEASNQLMVKLMNEKNISNNDSRLFFAQLFGMSDHISYNLSKEGYNVAKYLPFGSVKTVIPYLIRRAKENTSIAGQTSRELMLIKTELKKRRKRK